jgi:uncharacterized protein GlcG (DUF336 family)
MKLVIPALLAACCAFQPNVAAAADAGYAIRLMTPETALKAALAGQAACRKAGFQVAIAVVDRTGQVQVVLRDRFAGMHTVDAAIDKAWTAASFKMDTTGLAKATSAGTVSSGIRHIPRALAVGGGMLVEAAGAPYGAVGVSGAPSGDNDDLCARAAIDAVIDDLNL